MTGVTYPNLLKLSVNSSHKKNTFLAYILFLVYFIQLRCTGHTKTVSYKCFTVQQLVFALQSCMPDIPTKWLHNLTCLYDLEITFQGKGQCSVSVIIIKLVCNCLDISRVWNTKYLYVTIGSLLNEYKSGYFLCIITELHSM